MAGCFSDMSHAYPVYKAGYCLSQLNLYHRLVNPTDYFVGLAGTRIFSFGFRRVQLAPPSRALPVPCISDDTHGFPRKSDYEGHFFQCDVLQNSLLDFVTYLL